MVFTDWNQNRGGGPVGGNYNACHSQKETQIWIEQVIKAVFHAGGKGDGNKLYADKVNKRLDHLKDGKTSWTWPC